MKQNLIWVVAVLCVISLLVASAVSISRAKHLPDLPQEELQEQEQEQAAESVSTDVTEASVDPEQNNQDQESQS